MIALSCVFKFPEATCLTLILLLVPVLVPGQAEKTKIAGLKQRLGAETDLFRKAGLLNDLAWEYSFHNFDSSMHYTRKALALAEELDNTYWLAVATEMLAMLYEISGQAGEAASLYLKVIDLREQLGGDGLETTYNNLGVLFKTQGNNQKALEYFYKSYQLELAHNNPEGISGSLVNMAVSLTKLGRIDSSFVLLTEALDMARDHQINYILANVYLDLSNYYILKNQPDSALAYCNKIIFAPEALEVSDESLLIALQNAADVYSGQQQYAEALNYYNRVEGLVGAVNNLEYYTRLYAAKAATLAKLARYREAYTYMTKYSEAHDARVNTESVSILHELEKKYETAKKEQKIAALELHAARSRSQRNLVVFSLAGVVAGIIFLFVLFRQKSRANELISASLAEKETLLKEIHHRVKNNLQIISSLLNIQSRYISDKEAIQAVNEGKSRVKAMALIHQKLYQKDNLTGIDIAPYVRQLTESLFASFGVIEGQITLETDIEDLRLDVDTAIPLGLILNEMVTNALKYAFVDMQGHLSISLREQNHTLELVVKDNGKGFVEDRAGHGYGRRLIASLARKLQATLAVDGQNGTTCQLIIHKYKLV